MAKTSPTQRSLAYLREQGMTVAIVERWNAFAKIRQDLFGFIDLVALCPRNGIIGIQTTTKVNMQARVNKILAENKSKLWLEAGGRIIVHGWKKPGKRDKTRKWFCSQIEINKWGCCPVNRK